MRKGKIILLVVAALLVIGVIGKLAGVEAPSSAKEQTRSMPTETIAPTPKPTPKPTATPAPTPELTAIEAAPAVTEAPVTRSAERTWVLNTNTGKFHVPSCSSVSQMKDTNKLEFTGTREDVIAMGYQPCGKCHP